MKHLQNHVTIWLLFCRISWTVRSICAWKGWDPVNIHHPKIQSKTMILVLVLYQGDAKYRRPWISWRVRKKTPNFDYKKISIMCLVLSVTFDCNQNQCELNFKKSKKSSNTQGGGFLLFLPFVDYLPGCQVPNFLQLYFRPPIFLQIRTPYKITSRGPIRSPLTPLTPPPPIGGPKKIFFRGGYDWLTILTP